MNAASHAKYPRSIGQLIGPAPRVHSLLEKHELGINDIDLSRAHETFADQSLKDEING